MNSAVIIDADRISAAELCGAIEGRVSAVCTHFHTAEAALPAIEREQPDVVFVAVSSGWKSCVKRIKDNCEDTLVAIVTDVKSFDMVRDAIRLGVADIFLKPYDKSETERAVRLAESCADARHSYSRSDGADLISRALSYISENYYRSITLKEAAEDLNVSNWHLCKVLKAGMDKTFVELVAAERIKNAAKLMRETALSDDDIAARVGICDLSYFSALFKKLTGRTPSEYRQGAGLQVL